MGRKETTVLANNLRRGKSFGVAIIINVILLVLAQSLTSAAGSQSTTRRGGTIPPVHLPLSNHADSTSPNQDRWYAMVYHAGDFTGVHGTIEVADPVRRYNGAGNSGVKIATI